MSVPTPKIIGRNGPCGRKRAVDAALGGSRTVSLRPSSSASAISVADRHLLHAGHGAQEVIEVVAVEVVAGVQAQARRRRACAPRRRGNGNTCACAACRARAHRLGVELDAVGAGLRRAAHLRRHRSMNRLTRRPIALHSATSGARRARRREAPAVVGGELVDAVGHEGHLVLRAARATAIAHEVHQVVEGLPSMLYSACGQAFSSSASSSTSCGRMWRSSGRGCTVMPCRSRPQRQRRGKRITLGMPGGACCAAARPC